MITVASTDGVQLAVHDLGGAGRPLLWCHATGFHGRVWRAAAAEFPDRHNVAIDFRGFGASTGPRDGDFDWHGFGDDVLAVVDHFEWTDLQAVGHSKGGAALLMASLRRPELFDRLVLFEPIVFPATAPPPGGGNGNPLAEGARRRRESFDSYEAAIERFSGSASLGTLRPDVLEDYVRHGFAMQDDGSVRLKADRENEARTYEMGSQHGTFARLGEVKVPAMVARSGESVGPAAFAPLIADALPNGTLETFEELTHFGPLDDPVSFAAVVRDFLD